MQPTNANRPPTATPLGERYTLLDQIGEGTFAITYRARDQALDRIVAIKILRPQFAADPTFLARFEREARASARVNHPHVVHVYDYGVRDGNPYLVLHYVPGRDLKEALRRDGLPSLDEAVRVGGQILSGLDAIHQAGLIHRDIKPQNVLLDEERNALVTDFGIALNPGTSMLTGDGTTLGTPAYMAPEQAQGEPVTTATDLYAVGVVLFEMLTGRLPFYGDNPLTIMLAHVQNAPPRPSDLSQTPIPPAVEQVVLRAMAKDPRARFSSAGEMAHALQLAGNPNAQATGVVRPRVRPQPEARPTPPLGSTNTVAAAPTLAHRAAPVAATGGRDDQRTGRRGLLLLAPLVVVLIALAGWVIVNAMNDDDNGGNSPTPTEANGAAATSTRNLVIGGNKTETPQPTSTRDRSTPTPRTVRTATTGPIEAVATETTEPTATDTTEPTGTPEPTNTPRPTRTPEPPTPEPTEEGSQPTIAPSNNDNGTDGNGNGNGSGGENETTSGDEGIIPRGGNSSNAQGNSSQRSSEPVTLNFGPDDWNGGIYRGNNGFLGRPWVAIYGAQSGLGRVTLSFSLDTAPTGAATLTITGINDETGTPNPISIEVNDVEIFSGPAPFPSWDGRGNGHDAVWGDGSWTIPAGALRAGQNQIAVSNLTQSDATNSPPYVDLSTTVIEIS